MPIIDVPLEEIKGKFTFADDELPEEGSPEHDWATVAGASFEDFNILSSSMAYNRGHPGPLTKKERDEYTNGSFNPLNEVKGSNWDKPEYLDYVAKTRSKRELDWMIQNFEREARNDQILAEASTPQTILTGIAAGILDPVMAPTLAIPAIRGTMIKKIGATSAVATGLAVLDETLLHQTQPTRTLSESSLNIGGAAIFGALLGPLGPNLTKPEKTAIQNALDDEFHGVPIFLGDSASAAKVQENLPPGFMDEVDAMVQKGEITEQEAAIKVRDKRLEMLAFKKSPVFKAFAFGSPVLRVGTSNSVEARRILENLVEDSFIRTKNEYGMTSGPSVETIIKGEVNTNLANMNDILNREYAAYIGSDSKVMQTIKGSKKEILSFDEFAVEVGKAQRRSDLHEIPEVANAASKIRSSIDSPMETNLMKEGMLKEQMEDIIEEVEGVAKKTGEKGTGKAKIPAGDESYFARVYDFNKVMNNRIGFKQAIVKSIQKQIKDPEELAKFNEPGNLRIFYNELDDTISKITASPTGYFDKNIVPQTGFLKKRKINVPSKDIEDFLISDVRIVKESYMKNVVPHLELNKRFSGSDLSEELAAIDREYSTLIEKAGPNSKEAVKLNRELERVKKDVAALRDILLNRYKRPEDPLSVWNKAGHLVRAHNYITSLGGMTIASLPDVGNVIARVGLKPFAKGLKALATMPKEFNVSRKQAKKMAAGLDVVLHTRAQSLMMAEENITFQGKFDHIVDKTVRGFSKATGMTYWNAGLKQFAGTMYLDDIGGLLNKNLTDKQFTKFAAAGIDRNMWNRIKAQWEEFGTLDEGLKSPNIDQWTDTDARQALSAAVLKEVDTAVVTPGAGDLPLFSRGPVGKVVTQFKTFVFTSHNRIFLSNVQRLGLNQTAGFLSMMALASASYGMKEWAAGREPSSDWNTLTREMIDKSGYFGYLSDVNAITEKMTRGTVGLSAVLGGEPLTRYRAKSVIGDLLGPTAGKSADYATAIGAITSGIAGEDISESDIRAIRRLMPYQNLFYIRRFLNQLEQGAAEEFAE